MADIEPVDVEWLWDPYIPLGKVTLLDGDPGLGKSYLSLAIASAVSTGSPLPGQTEADPAADVVIMTAEDGLADTIRGRLDSLGADCSRIHAIEAVATTTGTRPLTLNDHDIARLDEALATFRPALVVIDPLVAYLGPQMDMNRANETRAVMALLAAIPAKHGCAILVVRHLNKATGQAATYRGMGSIDFLASVRSALLVGKHPDDPSGNERAIVHYKSNLAAPGDVLGYVIEDGRFWWIELPSPVTADQLLALPPPDGGQRAAARDAAEDFLQQLLADGPVESKRVFEEAKQCGISPSSVRRAQAQLGIKAKRVGGSAEKGHWEWSLPDGSAKDAAPQKHGHLRYLN